MIAREMADKLLYSAEAIGSEEHLERALELVRKARE